MGIFRLVFLLLFIGSFAKCVTNAKEQKSYFSLGKKWAVLVAGSDGWYFYRHQADISHAYQILVGNGVPKENIIVMMVDDIANNTQNPRPGTLINKPGGPDVYKGVVIDYKGKDVNSTNFLKIITGDKEGMRNIGSGRVLESGPLDKVFINFVDHGGPGLLCFPNDFLFADQLNDALNTMYDNGAYRKMLLYIEACFSGSVFDGILAPNTGVLAVTAAGPRESSIGCYCRIEPFKPCLGDLFSVTWMEDIDANAFNHTWRKKTIFNSYQRVRKDVWFSDVMIYGDFSVAKEKLSSFVGYKKSNDNQEIHKTALQLTKHETAVFSGDTVEDSLQYELTDVKLAGVKKHELAKKIRRNKEMRLVIDGVFRTLYALITKKKPEIKKKIGEFDDPNHLQLTLDMFPCYRSILNKITKSCFSLTRNPYSLKRLTIFANLCVIEKNVNQIVDKLIDVACKKIPKNIENVF